MLAIFDTEGVLIDGEFLPELAKVVGKEEKIWEITKKGISGEIEWEKGLIERINELKGVSYDDCKRVSDDMPIMEGAKEVNSPVIVQASAGARKYAGPRFIKSMMEAAVEEFPEIPIVMHQDHGGSPKDCKVCIDLGFSSVMMDGSLRLNHNKNSRWYSTSLRPFRLMVVLLGPILKVFLRAQMCTFVSQALFVPLMANSFACSCVKTVGAKIHS